MCNEYSIVHRMVVVLFLVLDIEVALGKEVVSSQRRTARVVSVVVLDVVCISRKQTKGNALVVKNCKNLF